MKSLHDLTGHNLAEAYRLLFPGEIPDSVFDELHVGPAIAFAFDTWLLRLRGGQLEHQLALDQSHTAKKTRALLLALEVAEGKEPSTLAELHQRLAPHGVRALTVRQRIDRRARLLRRWRG